MKALKNININDLINNPYAIKGFHVDVCQGEYSKYEFYLTKNNGDTDNISHDFYTSTFKEVKEYIKTTIKEVRKCTIHKY
tara:strand:- start:408 stop:647 length:240 start_codon:yes stop_codon:yes gene_type:complete